MTRKMVLLAAFACLLPCLAMAGSVSFTTTGAFSDPGLFPITFTGQSYTNVSASPANNLLFGTFSLGACPTKCNGSETFTLTIDQTSPTSGTGPLIGTLSGKVTKVGTNLSLTFTTATMTIGTDTYSIPFPSETINFKARTTLNGSAFSPVAEPNARLLLSLGTLGLMAATLVSRKLINT
jgi:hypothetical protein